MRAHSELVDYQLTLFGLKHLHGEHTGHIQRFGDALGNSRSLRNKCITRPWCRCDDFGTHPTLLDCLNEGEDSHSTGGATGHELGQFTTERDLLLQQHRACFEPFDDVGAGGDDAHPFSVVAATRSLRDGLSAFDRHERIDVFCRLRHHPPGEGNIE